MNLTWKQLAVEESMLNYYEEWEFVPKYFPTDFGACCLFVPHLYFEPSNPNISYKEIWFDTKIIEV